ncbi:MAG: 4'-phosphopantetheinyl transferase family protein [Janthinobacterium lividum]
MERGRLYIQPTEADWTDANYNVYTELKINQIWRVKTATLLSKIDILQMLLDAEEIEKFSRYQQDARQIRIVCRAVLRILIGRYLSIEPKEIKLKLDHQKKPVLQNNHTKNIHFNVSHSGDWILIALSTNPIGVDLEQINASFTYQNLLDFSFSLKEKSYIQTSKVPVESFYKLWTRKEALLKATGKGLIDELASIPSLDGSHQNPSQLINSTESWQITSFSIDENHIGSAAFMPVKTALQFLNFQL